MTNLKILPYVAVEWALSDERLSWHVSEERWYVTSDIGPIDVTKIVEDPQWDPSDKEFFEYQIEEAILRATDLW